MIKVEVMSCVSVKEGLIWRQFHEDRILAGDAEMAKWISHLVTELLIAVLKVEVRGQICHNDLHRGFSKCLSEANSLSTIERSVCKLVWID